MSALFVVPGLRTDRSGRIERLRRSFSKQGFNESRVFDWPSGSLHWYPSPDQDKRSALWVETNEGFAACVGMVFYDGHGGREALRRIWRDFQDPRSLSSDGLFGNYLLALGKRGQVWLFADRVGMVKLYQVNQLGILSTSWLSCVESLDNPRLDTFGAQEYVLLGANHGDRSPVAGVGIVDPAAAIELTSGKALKLTTLDDWLSVGPPRTEAQALNFFSRTLEERTRIIARTFDNRVRCALSGGFDSRLLVAALLKVGVTPELFVYGSLDSKDVKVARAAAKAIGAPLKQIDKSATESLYAGDPTAEVFENLAFFDGIPPDGLCDLATDRTTRLAQCAEGFIALNGGGGEILRNFFYLSDRKFTASQIEQTFYRPYAGTVFRSAADRSAFRDRMATSIGAVVGHGFLDRRVVELAYPLFRTRFWTSRNNSLAVRVGAFLTPFLDPVLVAHSAALPLAWKNYGRFESKLIHLLNSELGQIPLSYGFSPSGGPSFSYKMGGRIQQMRPPLLRGMSATLRAWMSGRRITSPSHLTNLLASPYVMDQVLDLASLRQEAQLMRALTLELLIQSYRIGLSAVGD